MGHALRHAAVDLQPPQGVYSVVTASPSDHRVEVSVSRPRRIRPMVSIVLGATMACWAATAVSRKQRWIGLVRYTAAPPAVLNIDAAASAAVWVAWVAASRIRRFCSMVEGRPACASSKA